MCATAPPPSYEGILMTDGELAVRKHCHAQLRKEGIEIDAEFRKLPWNELHEQRKALKRISRDLSKNTDLEGDDFDERMAANDYLAERVNGISDQIDLRVEHNTREPVHEGMPNEPVCRPITAGGEIEEAECRMLKPEQRMADFIEQPTESRISTGAYLRAMVLGAKTDSEKRALAEGTDSTGGYTVPTILSASLIDLMRSNNVAIQAGAMTVPLTSDATHIARLLTDPTPAWRAENAAIGESDPTFGRVVFEPKSLAVIVRVSRELLEDSLNIDTALPQILAASMAQELDRVVFLGTGSSNEPSGLDTLTDVQELAHDATITNYSALVTARRDLMRQNAAGITAHVMHPDTEAVFGGLTDTTNQPLNYPAVLDRPNPMRWLTTTKLPTDLGGGSNETTIYCGDFNQLVIGIRNDIRVEILRERYADNHQYGFVCHMRADVAAIQPKALLRITGVQLS